MKFKRVKRVYIAHNKTVKPVIGMTTDRVLFINIPYEFTAKRHLVRGGKA